MVVLINNLSPYYHNLIVLNDGSVDIGVREADLLNHLTACAIRDKGTTFFVLSTLLTKNGLQTAVMLNFIRHNNPYEIALGCALLIGSILAGKYTFDYFRTHCRLDQSRSRDIMLHAISSRPDSQAEVLATYENNLKQISNELDQGIITTEEFFRRIQDSIVCPITQEVVKDPVLIEHGPVNCFENNQLTQWLRNNPIHPLTRQSCSFDQCVSISILQIKQVIEPFMNKHECLDDKLLDRLFLSENIDGENVFNHLRYQLDDDTFQTDELNF